MTRRVKLGVVGLGALAQRGMLPHLAQDDALARIEPVALCDSVPGRAAASAEKWGWRVAYTSYQEMLARAEVEAVLLLTPIPAHYPQVKAALEAGRHVYVQKTMTTTLAEADEVVALAQASGRKVVASPGTLIRPPTPQVRDLVRSGAIGKVYWALTGMQSPGHEHETGRQGDDVLSNVDPTWYYQKGGGPVYDMAVYCLHELVDILGPVRRVSAMSGIGQPTRRWRDTTIEVEMDDNTVMTLDFGDATFAVVYGANCWAGGLPRMAIHGSEGVLEVGTGPAPERGYGPPATVRGPRVPGGTQSIERPDLPYRTAAHHGIYADHVYADAMHLVDCLLEEREPLLSAARARHVIEVIERAYEAARLGRTVDVSSTA